VRVREMMSTPVTMLDPTDSLAFAEELMNVEHVRHLPVVDGETLVGILSHRDIVSASISSLVNPSPEDDLAAKRKVQVREIMRDAVETIGPDENASMAADVLLMHKIGCLPVVDERLRLVGIVTEADFVLIAREVLATGKLRWSDEEPSEVLERHAKRRRATPEHAITTKAARPSAVRARKAEGAPMTTHGSSRAGSARTKR
jgi:CBS-domain-containing membrane protein